MIQDTDFRSNFWKREAFEAGFPYAGKIDHFRPDRDNVIFMLELSGEL